MKLLSVLRFATAVLPERRVRFADVAGGVRRTVVGRASIPAGDPAARNVLCNSSACCGWLLPCSQRGVVRYATRRRATSDSLVRRGILLSSRVCHPWKVGATEVLRACVPSAVREQVLREVHDSASGGHFGVDRTFLRAAQDFYWPRMRQDVVQHVASCHACQCGKQYTARSSGIPTPVADGRWSRWTSCRWLRAIPREALPVALRVLVLSTSRGQDAALCASRAACLPRSGRWERRCPGPRIDSFAKPCQRTHVRRRAVSLARWCARWATCHAPSAPTPVPNLH